MFSDDQFLFFVMPVIDQNIGIKWGNGNRDGKGEDKIRQLIRESEHQWSE